MSTVPPNFNPYAQTGSTVSFHPSQQIGSEAEQIRRKHLSHEASIKSVGLLYGFGFVLLCLMTLINLVGVLSQAGGQAPGGIVIGLVFVLLLAAWTALVGVTAWNLRKLTPLGKILGIIVAAIGLLGFPIGTLISAYILYLLLSERGTVVFSPQYKSIIAQTPHIKYKTSIIVWVLLAVIGLLFIVGIGFAMVS